MNKKTRQQKLDTINEASANLVATLKSAPETLEQPLVESITLIHSNHHKIASQAAKLHESTENLGRLNRQLTQAANAGDVKLRETGDVQNWAEMVDQNIRRIEKTIEIRKQNLQY